MQVNKREKQKGITIIALVITIVILIILATISMNAIFGENGLIQSSERAKFEHERAEAREQIELVLADAYAEKNLNKKEYNENEYLDEFVKERLPEVSIKKEEIGLNGFMFELDRSVPRIGKYKGHIIGPQIEEIKVIGKTTNSISIEVDARNAEEGQYTYSYKKENEGEESWKETYKGKEKIYTFSNLEANKIYNIKVKVTTKEGEAEGTINVLTGEMPQGVVSFDKVTWAGDGTAQVTINTSEEGYTLQYQINGIEEGKWQGTTSGSTISGLHHKDTVYGRIYDGTNGSNEASIEIIDEVAPKVTVEAGGTTTNSVTVNVQAVDNESGMKESPTYTYYIKQKSEPDESYVAKATDVTNTSYTFTGLIQETSYDVKVEVNGDKAGNKGTGALEGQVTTKVPDGGVEEGAITFGTPTWSNGQASVTVNTNTGMQIEYQVNALTEGNWKNISNGGTIGNLQHGQTVYARLTDGTNHGNYASVSVMDNIEPQNANINLSGTSTSTEGNITATVTLIDNESGVNITGSKWVYNTTAENIGTDEGNYNNTFTSNGETLTLKASTEGTYYLHVLTVDKAGNKKETISDPVTVNQLATGIRVSPSSVTLTAEGETKQLTATVTPSTAGNKSVSWSSSNTNVVTVNNNGLITAKSDGTATITATTRDGSNKRATCKVIVEYPTVEEKLEEGDYVEYKANTWHTCIVLYNNSSYGVQIITKDIVGTVNVSLSGSSFSTAMSNYNSAISKLNSEASRLGNSNYASSVRCVGSVPNSKNSESGYYKFDSNYSGRLRDSDNNYSKDWDQMGRLGIRKSNNYYWLASREVTPNSNGVNFGVRYSNSGGYESTQNLCYVYSDDTGSAYKASSHGIRPVITLKSTVKVTGGKGTSSDPYTLGL